MKKKISLMAAVFAVIMTMAFVLSACGATQTTETPQTTAAAEEATTADEAGSQEDTTAVDNPKEEVSFILEIDASGTTNSQPVVVECKGSGTLGDFMRSYEGCIWEDTEYGIFVTGFDDVMNDDSSGMYWMLYVDDESSMVGADGLELEDGAKYTWKYEGFE